MSNVASTRGASYQDSTGAAWSGNSVVLNPGSPISSSKDRHHTAFGFGQTLHDGCTIDGIQVQFNAHGSNASSDQNQRVGVSLELSNGSMTAQKSVIGLTTSSTPYSLGGATDLWGMPSIPASLLCGDDQTTGFAVEVVAVNTDTLFGSTDTVGNMTVTVFYTENGRPSMIQFSF